jgi:hypothetical protein
MNYQIVWLKFEILKKKKKSFRKKNNVLEVRIGKNGLGIIGVIIVFIPKCLMM